MATESMQSLARSSLNATTLGAFYSILVSTAELIDALLAEGIPYTKAILPPEVPDVRI